MHPFPKLPSLSLLAEGVVFLTDTSTLVVADVHLGKSAAFRARGLPVPEGDTARDLQRLLELGKRCGAGHLVIAGDLFHSPSGITPELEVALGGFIEELGIPLTLVAGNHDAKLAALPAGLTRVSHLDVGPGVRVVHDPAHAAGDIFHLSGHLHPVVNVRDGIRASLRLPCFILKDQTLVLPAFGSFTGGAPVKPGIEDRVFVPLRGKVVELPVEIC
ncbi:ligase-associated DNA damage response endonuclease PdeM [Luteolibacter yonseiensis]|uniref:Ligase-associated DNA damage response endonuclease PdeM n=1 Tax=Luteolibacter yonseiensis TaxID=1144680 RepID=A0A934VDC9_9BACT|nr:ligase-associated DNA damage response endonuclease PdeM [Luteolibacter yonseiensis]MBK1817434.1 ligase-associated DNA damage response endonuclease PdeM [Luteolibacter yonseiensis]